MLDVIRTIYRYFFFLIYKIVKILYICPIVLNPRETATYTVANARFSPTCSHGESPQPVYSGRRRRLHGFLPARHRVWSLADDRPHTSVCPDKHAVDLEERERERFITRFSSPQFPRFREGGVAMLYGQVSGGDSFRACKERLDDGMDYTYRARRLGVDLWFDPEIINWFLWFAYIHAWVHFANFEKSHPLYISNERIPIHIERHKTACA